MSSLHVLIAEAHSFSERAVELLTKSGFLLTMADLSRPELEETLPAADVLWVRLRNRIDADLLQRGKRLQYIVSATTGLNHLDEAAAAQRGIRILSLRGETEFLKNIHATAEHTLALMLALMRKLPFAASHVARGGWNRDAFRGTELFGKTVGVVGFGRVGRMVAQLVEAFGSKVLVNDPRLRSDVSANGFTPAPLPMLLAHSDIVSIHVDLNERTAGFFGKAQFRSLKPGALLINTSRGELVDEVALLERLSAGYLGGAALDVIAGESSAGMKAHPLVRYARRHTNLIITPHIGGCTAESMELTEFYLAQRLCREAAAGIQQVAAVG